MNTVPTAATRTGDFSNYRDRNGNLIPIYDPLTTRVDPGTGRIVRDQFPNNIIPQDRILSVGRNIASIYPLPNNGSSNFDNYISTPNREITDNAFSGRVDHRLSDNDTFFVRFNYGKFRLDAPQGQANCCLPTPAEAAAQFDLGPFVAGIQNTKLTTHGAAFNYSKILRPTLVNELRVGYANTAPFTTQSDYGHYSSQSLGIQGINISDITTGLPNIGITNFTGLSGGPAFLPVNPSQFHYQIEDVLVWLKGRHQLKFGYRLVDRRPSPFIHDNTRSAINFGTSFVNNPLTNSGGTGLAEVLLGYYNNASRGFLLEKPEFRVVEQAAFVQDDFKVSNRLTVNAGLRYEIFGAPTEKNNRLANFDYENFVIVYAGENGTSRSANKKTQYGNLAPRLGITYKLTSDASTILRTGFGITYFPSPYAAGNLNHLNVPFVISQNVNHETNPLDFSKVRTIADPFPPIVPVKPTTTAELIAANPRVSGHSYENETRLRRAVASRHRPAALLEAAPRGRVCRERREASRPLLQPQRGPARSRLRGVTPAAAADRRREQHAAMRSAQPIDVSRRNLEAAEAIQQRLPIPGELHLRQVTRLRQLRGERRRRGRQRADDHEHGRLARPVRVRRPPSRGHQLRLRTAIRNRSPLDERVGRPYAGPRRRLAAVGDHDDDDGAAVQRLAPDRRQQRCPELAQSDRIRRTRQPHGRPLVQSCRLRRTAAEHIRRRWPWHPLRPGAHEFRHVAVETGGSGGRFERRVPVGCVQPVQPSRLRVSQTARLATRMPAASRRPSSTTAACSSR